MALRELSQATAEDGAPGRGSGNRAASRPPTGENGVDRPYDADEEIDEIENAGQDALTEGAEPAEDDDYSEEPQDEKPTDQEFLQMLAEASTQSAFYSDQVNRRAWERAYKAYRQEHFTGSKYTSADFRNRSKLFIPKTRSAVRKDLAATSASLFGSIDAIECAAGNEADPTQRGAAAVIKELVNYRTDRANGKASLPWFPVAMGARQTSLMTGFCVTKQSWKLELRKDGTESSVDEDGNETERDVWKPFIDRPDCQLIPPENCIIDPACDWTDPAQDSAYFLIRYPMRYDEIRKMQRHPLKPWKKVSEQQLKACAEASTSQADSVRRSRDQGLDRYDSAQTGAEFGVIWVTEAFIRAGGEDWTFYAIGNKYLMTDPAPVGEVYPEQEGLRPITMGYGSFEAFCIFPQAAVESWQSLQQETNDVRNLTLDAFKQNVMPVTKVMRGRNIDLDQLKRRGWGSSIMVTGKDDVTWERPPDVPQSAVALKQALDIEFDDLAGQQNYGTVQNNNALGKTLGGLKLAAGAANAVQEFDIRVWIETWAERCLSQIVKLEQFYESDPIVLGLVGERAELMQKHGINEITDALLENSVTIRVSIGLGAGDPQQRLQKFQNASSIGIAAAQLDPRFQSGELAIDGEAVWAEVFGGAGYRDAGKRFIRKGQPKPSDMADAETADKKASAELKKAQAKKAVLDALSNAAKVGIALQDMELDKARHLFDLHHDHVEQIGRAQDMGHQHGKDIADRKNAAAGLNPDGTPLVLPGEEGSDESPRGAEPGGGAVPGGAPPNAVSPSSTPPPGATAIPMPEGMPEPAAPAAPTASPPSGEAPPSRKRKVTIAKRGPDGRASEFHIED